MTLSEVIEKIQKRVDELYIEMNCISSPEWPNETDEMTYQRRKMAETAHLCYSRCLSLLNSID